MSKSVLANKIGKTLFSIAKDNNVLSEVGNDLEQCTKAILEESSFITLMNNPNISIENKNKLIDSVFVNGNKYVINIIKILASDLKISLISDVLEVFKEMNNLFIKKVTVKIESVYKLTNQELAKLEEKIKEKLNVDNVEFDNVIDKSLIGGLRISYNGKVIDSSIKAKITDFRKKLSTI